MVIFLFCLHLEDWLALNMITRWTDKRIVLNIHLYNKFVDCFCLEFCGWVSQVWFCWLRCKVYLMIKTFHPEPVSYDVSPVSVAKLLHKRSTFYYSHKSTIYITIFKTRREVHSWPSKILHVLLLYMAWKNVISFRIKKIRKNFNIFTVSHVKL